LPGKKYVSESRRCGYPSFACNEPQNSMPRFIRRLDTLSANHIGKPCEKLSRSRCRVMSAFAQHGSGRMPSAACAAGNRANAGLPIFEFCAANGCNDLSISRQKVLLLDFAGVKNRRCHFHIYSQTHNYFYL
jgi:hypothetical protein